MTLFLKSVLHWTFENIHTSIGNGGNMLKPNLFARIAVPCLALVALLSSCKDSPTSASSDISVFGKWACVKFAWQDKQNGVVVDEGADVYTMSTTEHIVLFGTDSAFSYYVEPGNPTSGKTYITACPYSVSGTTLVWENFSCPIEKRGDTLVITEVFSDGYEKGFFLPYTGSVPPNNWPVTTQNVSGCGI
jgi:hypothetical protein